MAISVSVFGIFLFSFQLCAVFNVFCDLSALTLIKTMQHRRADVICVRLHTCKVTRRPPVLDNDIAASPDLREQRDLCVGNATREKVCVSKSTCAVHTHPYTVYMLHACTMSAVPAAGVIDR